MLTNSPTGILCPFIIKLMANYILRPLTENSNAASISHSWTNTSCIFSISISPFLSRSTAAQLNSSNVRGSVFVLVDVGGLFIFSLMGFMWWCGASVGNDCSSEIVGFQETAVVVSTFVFLLFVGNFNSDKMGDKEFRDGFFSVKDGISLLKFSTVDEVRAVFLLYHMKSIPKTIKHMPVTINKAKFSLGDNEKG